MKDYKILDETNPVPDVYPYDVNGDEKVILLDDPTVRFSTGLPLKDGISKLRFKYCKGTYKSNPSTLTIAVTARDYQKSYDIEIDDYLLYAKDPQTYCQGHSAEYTFEAPADASVVISLSSKYTNIDCIIWDVSWDDYEQQTSDITKPSDANWHSNYDKVLDLGEITGTFGDIDLSTLAQGSSVDISGKTFEIPDPNDRPISVSFSNAKLLKLADGGYGIDIAEGGSVAVSGYLEKGYSFDQLSAIRIFHQDVESSVFDTGMLDDNSQHITYWRSGMDSEVPKAIMPKGADRDERVVTFTAKQPVRVYGIAVNNPLVITDAAILKIDAVDESSLIYYNLNGARLSKPVRGALVIRRSAGGTEVIRY